MSEGNDHAAECMDIILKYKHRILSRTPRASLGQQVSVLQELRAMASEVYSEALASVKPAPKVKPRRRKA